MELEIIQLTNGFKIQMKDVYNSDHLDSTSKDDSQLTSTIMLHNWILLIVQIMEHILEELVIKFIKLNQPRFYH